eukprot:gene16265-31129_t
MSLLMRPLSAAVRYDSPPAATARGDAPCPPSATPPCATPPVGELDGDGPGNRTFAQEPGSVQVYLRVRPPARGAGPGDALRTGPCGASPHPCDTGGGCRGTEVSAARDDGRREAFRFTQVFPPEAGQEDVFAAVSSELISPIFGGVNVCLMAYGQTGSGKTYTMTGGRDFRHPNRRKWWKS